jgi:hypothetical protein
MTPKKQQNHRLDEVTINAMRIMAEKENRSQAEIIASAVEEYFLKHFEAEFERIASDATRNDQS